MLELLLMLTAPPLLIALWVQVLGIDQIWRFYRDRDKWRKGD